MARLSRLGWLVPVGRGWVERGRYHQNYRVRLWHPGFWWYVGRQLAQRLGGRR